MARATARSGLSRETQSQISNNAYAAAVLIISYVVSIVLASWGAFDSSRWAEASPVCRKFMCGTSIFYRCLCSQFPAPFVFLNVKPGTFLETRRPSLRSGNVPQGKLPLSLPDVRNTDQITRVAAIVAYLAADFVFVDAVAILFASQARGVLLLTTVALYILVGIVGNCAIFVILSRVFSYETAKSCAWVFIKLYPIRKGLFVVSGVLALMTSVVRTAGDDRDLSTNKKNE